MSKVKINKVVPFEQYPNSKNPAFIVDGNKYVIAPTSIQQNYAGYPIIIYLTAILPQSNNDYQYLKLDIKVQNTKFKTILNKKQQTFKDISKVNAKRQAIFEFVPPNKGNYTINLECMYRIRYFVQGSQPPPEKNDQSHFIIKCDEPIEVREFILSEDRAASITFPLFLQYSIESKLPGQEIVLETEFTSEKFKFKELHNQRKIRLKKQEVYYLMLEIQPKSLKQILNQKGITIGQLSIRYGNKGVFEKKTALQVTNKYVFFKANTITKEVPKKDFVQVQAIFSKIYNVNLNLGSLKLVIDERQMPQVKILKTSVDGINLDQNKEVSVIFTIICLKSGPVHLKGISLQNADNATIHFINDLTLNVGIEPERKHEAILQNTAQFNIDQLI